MEAIEVNVIEAPCYLSDVNMNQVSNMVTAPILGLSHAGHRQINLFQPVEFVVTGTNKQLLEHKRKSGLGRLLHPKYVELFYFSIEAPHGVLHIEFNDRDKTPVLIGTSVTATPNDGCSNWVCCQNGQRTPRLPF